VAQSTGAAPGEIDLIAEMQAQGVVYVRRRPRATGHRGSRGPTKARHLMLAASRYLGRASGGIDWRIDVIAITAGPGPKVRSLEHFLNAVEGRLP
jgi:Holliday junction resolvase-like predicted endonuclease